MRINDTLEGDRGNGGIDCIAATAQDLDRSERDSRMRGRGHAPVAHRQRAPRHHEIALSPAHALLRLSL